MSEKRTIRVESDGEDGFTVAGVDPTDFALIPFKYRVYEAIDGIGSWVDDARLEALWRLANDKEIPVHLQPLLKDVDDE
jgi:hypothetical protein